MYNSWSRVEYISFYLHEFIGLSTYLSIKLIINLIFYGF